MATTVGPEITSSFTDLTIEHMLSLQKAYRSGGVLADQYSRGNLSKMDYDGNTLRFTVMRNLKQGTGIATETGTLPVGRKIRTVKGNVGIAALEHTVSISPRLIGTTKNQQTSMASALELEMSAAREAMIKTRNELLNGTGDGLLATVSATTSASAAATVLIKVAGANMGLLYRGRVVDVLTRSNLATIKLGAIIVDVDETAGAETITIADASDDTATFVADTASTSGVYIENANQGAANILQGYGAAIAQSGTFEGIDRAVAKDWKAVDGRNADTSSADLGIGIFQSCLRRLGRNLTPGQSQQSLWITSQGCLDKFEINLTTQARWAGDKGRLDSGFEYLAFRGERLFADFDAPLSQATRIPLDDVSLAEIGNGPEFDSMDGSIWKRFNRAFPLEAWLKTEEQAVYQRLDRFVFAKNLVEAT